MKKLKLVYLFVIVGIITVNILSVKSTSTNLITLSILKNALAIECPEGTPPDQDEQNASISCVIYCDAHDTSLLYHFVFGTQVICIEGCSDCTPGPCSAKKCTRQT